MSNKRIVIAKEFRPGSFSLTFTNGDYVPNIYNTVHKYIVKDLEKIYKIKYVFQRRIVKVSFEQFHCKWEWEKFLKN